MLLYGDSRNRTNIWQQLTFLYTSQVRIPMKFVYVRYQQYNVPVTDEILRYSFQNRTISELLKNLLISYNFFSRLKIIPLYLHPRTANQSQPRHLTNPQALVHNRKSLRPSGMYTYRALHQPRVYKLANRPGPITIRQFRARAHTTRKKANNTL